MRNLENRRSDSSAHQALCKAFKRQTAFLSCKFLYHRTGSCRPHLHAGNRTCCFSRSCRLPGSRTSCFRQWTCAALWGIRTLGNLRNLIFKDISGILLRGAHYILRNIFFCVPLCSAGDGIFTKINQYFLFFFISCNSSSETAQYFSCVIVSQMMLFFPINTTSSRLTDAFSSKKSNSSFFSFRNSLI